MYRGQTEPRLRWGLAQKSLKPSVPDIFRRATSVPHIFRTSYLSSAHYAQSTIRKKDQKPHFPLRFSETRLYEMDHGV